jgi:hypothetical protein
MQNCSETVSIWRKLNKKLNVVVEWLTLLLRIRGFPVSNFGPETGYPDRGLPRPLQVNGEIIP